jgi:hypothetical protein
MLRKQQQQQQQQQQQKSWTFGFCVQIKCVSSNWTFESYHSSISTNINFAFSVTVSIICRQTDNSHKKNSPGQIIDTITISARLHSIESCLTVGIAVTSLNGVDHSLCSCKVLDRTRQACLPRSAHLLTRVLVALYQVWLLQTLSQTGRHCLETSFTTN